MMPRISIPPPPQLLRTLEPPPPSVQCNCWRRKEAGGLPQGRGANSSLASWDQKRTLLPGAGASPRDLQGSQARRIQTGSDGQLRAIAARSAPLQSKDSTAGHRRGGGLPGPSPSPGVALLVQAVRGGGIPTGPAQLSGERQEQPRPRPLGARRERGRRARAAALHRERPAGHAPPPPAPDQKGPRAALRSVRPRPAASAHLPAVGAGAAAALSPALSRGCCGFLGAGRPHRRKRQGEQPRRPPGRAGEARRGAEGRRGERGMGRPGMSRDGKSFPAPPREVGSS